MLKGVTGLLVRPMVRLLGVSGGEVSGMFRAEVASAIRMPRCATAALSLGRGGFRMGVAASGCC